MGVTYGGPEGAWDWVVNFEDHFDIILQIVFWLLVKNNNFNSIIMFFNSVIVPEHGNVRAKYRVYRGDVYFYPRHKISKSVLLRLIFFKSQRDY